MFAKLNSMGVFALNGFSVQVEADISGGLPQFSIVGLPDSAVKESADRVRTAMKNLGYSYPVSRVTVNLAPADTRKTGPVYDLPIFLSLLAAEGRLPAVGPDCAFVGELSLDGSVRGVSGVLPMALAARKHGIRQFFVPAENAAEAAVVDDLTVYPVRSAEEAAAHLRGDAPIAPAAPLPPGEAQRAAVPDFSDVRGQLEARRALEVAASGRHNILFVGSAGSGKSMLARRLPGILPPLTREEALETTSVYSVAGKLPAGCGLIRTPPLRAPHHTVSSAGLVGGGTMPRPGEVSLAHNGVLFLDELPEFRRDVLELLRQPLEDGTVTVSRAAGSGTFPCRIMFVAAMNPCPCGNFGHPTKACTCTPPVIDRYLHKISGPLLDRIDLHVELRPVEYDDLASDQKGEATADIALRVLRAREVQAKRYAGTDITCNSQLAGDLLREVCRLQPDAQKLLRRAFERMGLSARAHDRVLKVSRTIADLDGSADICAEHVSEAVQYRSLDRKYWYNR